MVQSSKSLVIHVPHSSVYIPRHLEQRLLVSKKELRENLLALTDHRTNGLFYCRGAEMLVFPCSRMVCDVERFCDDADEPMSKVGCGVIYEKDAFGRQLRQPPSPEERAAMLREYYEPHHLLLEEKVNRCLEHTGRCLIVDGHSFSSVPLPYEPDQNPGRPDICIGTCEGHTPDRLLENTASFFVSRGYRTDVDRPYAGSIVPLRHMHDSRVQSIMIEVNRGLYMQSGSFKTSGGYGRLKKDIGDYLKAALWWLS